MDIRAMKHFECKTSAITEQNAKKMNEIKNELGKIGNLHTILKKSCIMVDSP